MWAGTGYPGGQERGVVKKCLAGLLQNTTESSIHQFSVISEAGTEQCDDYMGSCYAYHCFKVNAPPASLTVFSKNTWRTKHIVLALTSPAAHEEEWTEGHSATTWSGSPTAAISSGYRLSNPKNRYYEETWSFVPISSHYASQGKLTSLPIL